MKPDYKRRLEALEQRSHSKTVPAGLGHFYSMTREEQERSLAPFYGEVPTNGKP